jgi:hypothetical protein
MYIRGFLAHEAILIVIIPQAKSMRRIWLIFGLLDLALVATYANRLPAEIRYFGYSPWISTICLLMMGSLVASGYGLLRGREWALVLNYIQFPFRIALAFLSLTWLAELIEPAHATLRAHEMVWMSIIAVEGVRLGVTIILHLISRGRLWIAPALR